MKAAKELIEALSKINKKEENVIAGIVKEVHDDNTADVDVDGVMFFNCRLKSISGNLKGIKAKPAVDSVVLIEKIGGKESEEYFIAMVSTIDEFLVEIGDKVYKLDSTGHRIAAGNDTLLQVIELICDAGLESLIINGNELNKTKLSQAKSKAQNILK